jgi:hypothetical protein
MTTDTRPIGVQIVAPFGHDAVVLEIAQRLETLAPWADRWPAVSTWGDPPASDAPRICPAVLVVIPPVGARRDDKK